jgi:predicted nucleic acid-binding protein
VSRILLDAGALIALDRNQPSMWRRFARAHQDAVPLLTHGGVIGQVWRHGRQARLSQALRSLDVRPLDAALGRLAGQLLAESGTSDVIDAALVLLSRDGDRIYTSDLDDLLRLATAAPRDVEVVLV